MTTTAPNAQNMTDQQLTPPYTVNDYPSSNYATQNAISPQRQTFVSVNTQPFPKQIRPPKSPLYVPAVLRPTELRSRRPITPPRSLHSSTDSLSRMQPGGKVSNTQAQPISIITTLTRSSTSSSGPSTPSSVQPTRAHWKPDSSTTHCEAPGCSLAFSFLARRHHCRRCGGIYCGNHAGATVPLDENAEIDENGSWHRACDNCFSYWDTYSRGLDTGRALKIAEGTNKAKRIPGSRQKTPDAAGSMPKDWSWSTF